MKVSPRRIAAKKLPNERRRIDKEVAQRIEERSDIPSEEQTLSRVELVMRRNAPDLAGASEEEVTTARIRRFAYTDAKWPRPRLAALVFAGLVGAFHPLGLVRLMIWGIVIFMVASVAVGPESARDGANFFWRRTLRFWKVELFLGLKLVRTLKAQIGGGGCGLLNRGALFPPHSCLFVSEFDRKNAFCASNARIGSVYAANVMLILTGGAA
ncbi:hypothetical protein [Shimia gijangensis]|uniref:hypothetical protein n=1 Tax=Shimia gijangensis TaxID=1470563 RepID=UPI001114A0E3|nr:hypothetical protein [Shimia gijangensis]